MKRGQKGLQSQKARSVKDYRDVSVLYDLDDVTVKLVGEYVSQSMSPSLKKSKEKKWFING